MCSLVEESTCSRTSAWSTRAGSGVYLPAGAFLEQTARHGSHDEFKADDRATEGRSFTFPRSMPRSTYSPRLIIPAIFYYGRAFIYHARIVNRWNIGSRKGGAAYTYTAFTAGLNQIRPLSYIIVCLEVMSTTLAIQFLFLRFST